MLSRVVLRPENGWLTSSHPVSECSIFRPDVSQADAQQVRHVPKWFPGATFRKFTSAGRHSLDISITVPFNIVKQRLQVRFHTFRCESTTSD